MQEYLRKAPSTNSFPQLEHMCLLRPFLLLASVRRFAIALCHHLPFSHRPHGDRDQLRQSLPALPASPRTPLDFWSWIRKIPQSIRREATEAPARSELRSKLSTSGVCSVLFSQSLHPIRQS